MIMGSACRLMNISMYMCTICTLVVLGFTTHQPLWVILCRLLEKGRKKIEEILEKMKGVGWVGDWGGEGDKSYRTPSPHPTTPSIHVHYGGIIALFTEVK